VPALAWQNAVEKEGVREEDMYAALRSRLDAVSAESPELVRQYNDHLGSNMRAVQAVSFDYGLMCVLDGLEARLRDPSHHADRRPDPASRRTPAHSDTI
jgi:hypothetical protein